MYKHTSTWIVGFSGLALILGQTVGPVLSAFEGMDTSLSAPPIFSPPPSIMREENGVFTDLIQANQQSPWEIEGVITESAFLEAIDVHGAPKAEETTVPTPLRRQPNSVVGMYLTPSSVARPDFLRDTMEKTGEGGGNAIVFDVKGSKVFFDADAPMAKELGLIEETYDLSAVLQMAKERGIYVIGRLIAVKDAGFTKVRPDTLIKHPQTGRAIGYEFIDPANEDALTYNKEVICSLATMGIDEINLDYIRFSTEQVGALLTYSTEEKSARVLQFVQMARRAIDECGPSTALGISTFAILGWNYELNVRTLGQDVISMAPYVDIISPMAYPATFAPNAYYSPGRDPGSRMYFLVWKTLKGYQEFLGQEHAYKLRPWIQGYGITKKNIADQMQAVADAGVCGFTVWNADNAYATTYAALPSFERPATCVDMPYSTHAEMHDVDASM